MGVIVMLALVLLVVLTGGEGDGDDRHVTEPMGVA